jgi:hypothetical protein
MWRVLMSSVAAEEHTAVSIATDVGICKSKVRTPCIRQHDFVDLKFVRLAETAKDTIRDFFRMFLELFNGGGISRARFVTGIGVDVVLVNHKAAVDAKGVPPLAEWGELGEFFGPEVDHEKCTWPLVERKLPAC